MATGTPIAAIGVKIGYMITSSKVSPPSTYTSSNHFTRIYDLKSTPSLNPSPNTADSSTFDNTEYTTYVELLKDIGGALEFTANLTDSFISAWESICNAYDNKTSSQHMWFVIDIPGVNKSVYFVGKPSENGMPTLTANTLMETSVYITPLAEPKWVTDPVSGYNIWGESIPSGT